MKNLIRNLSIATLISSVIILCSHKNPNILIRNFQCQNQTEIVLESNNVQSINLSNQPITKSGKVSSQEPIGYTFQATSGQKLHYETKQDICIWIYTPNNQILSTSDLPTTGKYTIQVSARNGSTDFQLKLSLESVIPSPPQPTVTKTISVPQPTVTKTISVPQPTVTKTISVPQPTVTKTITVTKTVYSPTPTPSSSDPWGIRRKSTKNTPTPTTSRSSDAWSNNVDRPSPKKVITDYYNKVNNRRYRDAWNILPTTFQRDKKLYPNGYNSFTQRWGQVNYINLKQVGMKNNGDTATVTIRCEYNLASGRQTYSTVKYYLQWSKSIRNWKISDVKIMAASDWLW